MSTPTRFRDIELAVITLLGSLVDNANTQTGTVTPDNFADQPFIRATRTGGNDDGHTDRARIQIDVFDVSRAGAWDLAEAVRALITSSPWKAGGVNIDTARTESAIAETPWDSASRIRRLTASYRLTARR